MSDSWHFGSRVSRIRASHSYGLVLVLVIAVFFVTALAPDDDWAGSSLVLLTGASLVAALWTSGIARLGSTPSVVFIAIAVIAAVLNITPGGRWPTASVSLVVAVLTFGTVVAIGVGVIDQGEVNRQTIRGAICIYILLGLVFVSVYGALTLIQSQHFFAQGTDGTRSIRLYFSYVTLATLGYGDYTASSQVGRAAAVVETLIGQLYLVTVLALLVSRLRFDRSDEKPGGGSEPVAPAG
jgi:hypothetical protein